MLKNKYENRNEIKKKYEIKKQIRKTQFAFHVKFKNETKNSKNNNEHRVGNNINDKQINKSYLMSQSIR